MPSVRGSLRTGDMLGGRYRIVRLIGQGGMGAVYLADDLKLPGKQWAVKETRMHIRQKEAFLDEARVLSRLDHPFLPHIVDFYPPDGNGFSYLVMDFVQGRTLAAALQRDGRIAVDKALRYAVQLCEVFEYLHNFRPKPIIYRDLKPSNIMVDEQDNIRLIDFGIARHYSHDRVADTVHLGTVGFAAPEQFEEKQTDARTDLYTLGAVMFYLLSGGIYYRPEGETLQSLRPDLPEGFAAVIGKLLQRDPGRRFQKAADVKAALLPLMLVSSQDQAAGQAAAAVVRAPAAGGGTVPFRRRVLVVGGLYGGAGATFAALALARVLNRYGVPQAVVELPGSPAELFHLLDGDRKAPKGYRFRSLTLEDGGARGGSWQDGLSEWIPLPPDAACGATDPDLSFRLLHTLPQPMVIVDVGSRWSDPAVRELCLRSDMTAVVAGPNPAKLASVAASGTLEFLQRLHRDGRSVELIANRDVQFAGRGEWLSSLPRKPVAVLPELPPGELLACQWKGRLPQDKPEHLQLLDAALKPLIRQLIPELNVRRKRGTLIFFWRKR